MFARQVVDPHACEQSVCVQPDDGACALPQSAPVGRSLQDRLAATHDYDVASGLHHVGGQMTVLARVLRRFVQSYAAGEPTLLVSDAPDSLQRWRSVCHSLRSACAAVGAARLAAQLQAFEDELAGSPEVASLAGRAQCLQEELVSLTRRLEAELDA